MFGYPLILNSYSYQLSKQEHSNTQSSKNSYLTTHELNTWIHKDIWMHIRLSSVQFWTSYITCMMEVITQAYTWVLAGTQYCSVYLQKCKYNLVIESGEQWAVRSVFISGASFIH